jgi:hypothetical protein
MACETAIVDQDHDLDAEATNPTYPGWLRLGKVEQYRNFASRAMVGGRRRA